MCEPAHDHAVATDDLLPVDAEILALVRRTARRSEPPSNERGGIAGPASLDRPGRKIDIAAFELDFLHDRVFHGLRCHVEHLFQQRQRAPGCAQAARRLGRAQRREHAPEIGQGRGVVQPEGRGNALLRAEQVREHADSARARTSEQQRRPAPREDASRHFGDLELGIERRVDRLELAAPVEKCQKFA